MLKTLKICAFSIYVYKRENFIFQWFRKKIFTNLIWKWCAQKLLLNWFSILLKKVFFIYIIFNSKKISKQKIVRYKNFKYRHRNGNSFPLTFLRVGSSHWWSKRKTYWIWRKNPYFQELQLKFLNKSTKIQRFSVW